LQAGNARKIELRLNEGVLVEEFSKCLMYRPDPKKKISVVERFFRKTVEFM
jgi:hypothetical protein